jgi:AraC-like DNA-binding protein
VLHFGRETEGRLKVSSLEFAHKPDDVREFERVLRCPVHAQAGWSGLLLPGASWRLPMRRRDEALKGMLERQAKETVARAKKGSGAAFEVGRLLVTRVAGRDTRLAVVARQLGTTARTLQRKLAAEGASYAALLEEARRRAAENYLSEPTLSVGEIGYLLGYSEPAAFHRAFRRWHRTTPAAYRQRAAARSNE